MVFCASVGVAVFKGSLPLQSALFAHRKEERRGVIRRRIEKGGQKNGERKKRWVFIYEDDEGRRS